MQHKDLKNILYIGDSHSAMTFGQVMRSSLLELNNELRPVKMNLFYYAVSGSSFLDWINGTTDLYKIRNVEDTPQTKIKDTSAAIKINLLEKISETKSQILIVALGTNDIFQNRLNLLDYLKKMDFAFAQIHSLYPSLKLIWILPPDVPSSIYENNLSTQFKNLIDNIEWIDTVQIKGFYPDQDDLVHFKKAKAIEYSKLVFKKLSVILKKYLEK